MPVSDADAQLVVAAAKKVLTIGMPNNQWPSRSMFAPDGKGVDDSVGILLNEDGNGWNVQVILGYLFGVAEDVANVERCARGEFDPTSYVAQNAWLKARCQEFATKLIAFKSTFLAGPGTPPAKTTAAKKTAAKKGT